MVNRYNLKTGILFSLVIAMLASIPALIRQNIGLFLINLVVLFLRILICWFIHHLFLLQDFRRSGRRPSGMRTFLSITVATVVILAITLPLKGDLTVWGVNKLRPWQTGGVNLFRCMTISAFSYFVVYYLQVNKQLQQSRLENEYLKQDQLKAQLFSLQQQISPHFLFNSLSTLRTIATDQMTKTYVTQLANVYRYLLTFHDSPRITVAEELAFTKSYLYILQERFEEALQVSIEIGAEYLPYYLPPLTLQILIENALKHNVVSIEEPLRLKIYTREEGVLVIENSYQPKPAMGESNGIGLQNIDNRYRLLAGRQIEVSQGSGVFKVTLPLLTT